MTFIREFDYDDNSSIENAVKEAKEAFKSILHLYDEIIDTESFYNKMLEIEMKLYGRIIKDSSTKIYVCIKLNKLEEALMYIQHVEAGIKHWLESRLDFLKENYKLLKDDGQSTIKQAEDDIRPIQLIKEAILKKDMNFLYELIKKNEEIVKISCENYLKIKL